MHGDACPFNDAEGLLKFLAGNMQRKKDNFLISEGPEGAGKSTTTGNLCMRLNPAFDVERDTIMSLDHLLDVLSEGQMYRVYDLDEAINIFHNQDWATWTAKALSKIIRQMRIMRCTWILNVPDYEGLHPYLRMYRARMRLYHPPVWDENGMGNGPSQFFWKREWFDFRDQRVKTRWEFVFDLNVQSLDEHPRWKPYEQKKVQNFRDLVHDMRTRLDLENAKETKKRQN